MEIESEWVSAAATLFAGIATIAAAITTHFAYRLQRNLAKNTQQILKGDALLKSMQTVITTFADIHATAKQEWSAERTDKLRLLGQNLRYTETVIKSLSPSIGEKIERWRFLSDANNDSIPRIVDFVLAGHGAGIGDKYDEFLFLKAEELRKIQDEAFEELSV